MDLEVVPKMKEEKHQQAMLMLSQPSLTACLVFAKGYDIRRLCQPDRFRALLFRIRNKSSKQGKGATFCTLLVGEHGPQAPFASASAVVTGCFTVLPVLPGDVFCALEGCPEEANRNCAEYASAL